MMSIPGSLSFAKLVMMSSARAKSAEDARYASLIVPYNVGSKRNQECVFSTSNATTLYKTHTGHFIGGLGIMVLLQVYESNSPKQKRRNQYTSSENGGGGGTYFHTKQ